MSHDNDNDTAFPVPATNGFTVFSKSGCVFCDKVKTLVAQKGHDVCSVNCDAHLTGERREAFLAHLTQLTQLRPPNLRFPFVFHNAVFIGGVAATQSYFDDNNTDNF